MSILNFAQWFLFLPGVLVHRDMVVVDHPALSAWNFGTAPGVAARNAPQDGVLALVGLIVPASWLARFILVASAIAGCVAATKNAKSLTGEVAAMAVLVWNPFVVERLLQGHWTVVAAFWLLPLVAYLGRRPGTQAIAMWAASLTPTGAIAAATGLVTSTNRRFTALFSLGMSLPWLIHRPVGSATDVFRPSSVLELVGLGGMWNSEVTPGIYVPLAGIALAAFLLTARAEKSSSPWQRWGSPSPWCPSSHSAGCTPPCLDWDSSATAKSGCCLSPPRSPSWQEASAGRPSPSRLRCCRSPASPPTLGRFSPWPSSTPGTPPRPWLTR
ncbi:hypothetical protein [Corynebacterium glucuronolyticum]|uniref:hypothetical protein n=1 Tax=Corynebacterium glucuronolyticum TaxID=39791 RepID=UPI00223B5F1F|nr:hypothetical protein [Corynebacterium glucuronolyticum]MCT1564355.1 hypothetical protein [Corynebacterium glucuronolyticum]